MDMPPPPARKPSKVARVLPPVPRETPEGPVTSADATAPPVAASPASPAPTATAANATASVSAAPIATTNATIALPASDAPDGAVPTRPSTAPVEPPPRSAAPAAAPTAAPLPAGSFYTLPLWSAAPLHPYSLSVLKDGRELEVLPLTAHSHFLLGRAADLCDIVLEHASVSRRHAVLQFHENGSLWIYDLGTAHGTFINRSRERVTPHIHIQLHVGDQLRFGASTRIYVVEGPEEARPKEIDTKQRQAALQKQHAMAKEQQRLAQLEESKRERAAGADAADAEGDTGASWGMQEDAVDDDDEDDDRRVGSVMMGDDDEGGGGRSRGVLSLPAKLTSLQQKLVDKLDKKREKLQNLSSEVEVLRSKDIKQGGLTEGQEKQIAKNEERVQALGNEIAEIEEQLQESIERVAGDRQKNKAAMEGKAGAAAAASKKRRRGSDDDDDGSDRSDEDDDFFDRTKAPKLSSSATNIGGAKDSTTSAGGPGSAASSFLSSLTPLSSLVTPDDIAAELKRIELKRDQMRHTLSEVMVAEAKAKRVHASSAGTAAAGVDSLDSFMNVLSHQQMSARIAGLKKNLSELQTHFIKLQRTMEQKKGEQRAQAYLAGDKAAFTRPDASATVHAPSAPALSSITPAATPTVTAPAVAPQAAVAPAAATTAAAAAASPPTVPSVTPRPAATPIVPFAGVSSTAAMLAALKKKQAAASRKQLEQSLAEEREEEQRAQIQAAQQPAARALVKALVADSAPPAAPLDRYAQLAAQLEAARGHKNYNQMPDDDVSRALKAREQRSADSFARGLSGDEERGGLHVRKKTDAPHEDGARSAAGSFSAPRGVGPSAPTAESAALQRAQAMQSEEWTPPVAAATAGQDKLRAKFAGRY